jgi:1-phosphofructokinase family hexose kinase
MLPAAGARARLIITITLNPAVDEAMAIDEIRLGELNRCQLDAVDPGGKGLNASRVIARLGRPTLALGFVAGVTGALIRSRLDAEHVSHAFDDVDGLTRINVMLLEHAIARRTRLYLPGARVTPADLERLYLRLEPIAPRAIVVLGGSIPPGLPLTVYGELVEWLHARGARTIVDTSGEALERTLAAGPELIKPNVEEAVALLGRPIQNDDDAIAAAAEFRRRGVDRVVISQGASGAIGLDASGAWKARPPAVHVRSTVGSGDSMVAGLAIALCEGLGLAEGLRLGSAAGAATCVVTGTQLGSREDVERFLPQVVVEPLRATALV